ncbi:hypothetical protein [Stenotrophomonas sp.]|uniref:hypothetical protein n=1 Tax=Stenotrophomonas sp. TaxID=69392 RepID=UPI0028A0838F|nr:hypothetical protein [Stenotrophomonas sp.]
MRSHNQQLDIFDHDPRLTAPKLAKAFRAAADEALKQFQFSDAVRQERHDYYLGEAKRHDAIAKQAKRAGGRRTARKKAVR